jgi:hypothetical protein
VQPPLPVFPAYLFSVDLCGPEGAIGLRSRVSILVVAEGLPISQKPVYGHFRASFFVIGILFFAMLEKRGGFQQNLQNTRPIKGAGFCFSNTVRG